MARWGDEKTIHFIYLYRQRECLWNTRSPLYKNKLAREYAYQSILQQFNDKHLDIKSVKTKIKNLRSVYHTELKKVKERCGSDGSFYKPSLSWFDEMHAFLGDSLEDRSDSTSGIAKNEMEAQGSSAENSGLSLQNPSIEQITIEGTLEPNLDPLRDSHQSETALIDSKTFSTTSTPATSAQQHIKPIKRRIYRRNRPHTDNTVLNAIQRLENRVSDAVIISQQEQVHPQREDEFYMFALSVAAQLRQLPLHIAIATQSKIQTILSEARLASIFSNTLSSQTLTIKSEDTSD